jgi:FG-GAP repeat
MRRTMLVVALVLMVVVAGAWPAWSTSGRVAFWAQPVSEVSVQQVDFNGDGFTDLAVGVPGEVVGGATAGAVNILYGAAGGLTGANQLLTQANPEEGDSFGSAVAKGDFNHDGFTDLAVGVPDEGLAASKAGAVNVFYGSGTGLAVTSQVLTQANPEEEDRFGGVLETGLFNDDPYMDLAVGVPNESHRDEAAGAVNVFYGSAGGLQSGSQVLVQAHPGPFDFFGSSLAAGYFNGGQEDLAVGSPDNFDPRWRSAGAVNVFYGTPSGLPGSSQVLLQGNPETGDRFGRALAAGRFDADQWYDLAVGAPTEDVAGMVNPGAVNIFFGSATKGLAATARQTFIQGVRAGGQAEPGDHFGSALAAGPFDSTGGWELAIGTADEDLGAKADAGAVNVLYGSTTGLVGRGQVLTQGSPGVVGAAEAGDRFGGRFAQGIHFNDFNGDGRADLAIAVPGESLGAVIFAGAVNVLYGSANGLPGTGGQLLTQDSPGVADSPEESDGFGRALD